MFVHFASVACRYGIVCTSWPLSMREHLYQIRGCEVWSIGRFFLDRLTVPSGPVDFLGGVIDCRGELTGGRGA